MPKIINALLMAIVLHVSGSWCDPVVKRKPLSLTRIGVIAGTVCSVVALSNLYTYLFEAGKVLTQEERYELDPRGVIEVGIPKNGKKIRFRQLQGEPILITESVIRIGSP